MSQSLCRIREADIKEQLIESTELFCAPKFICGKCLRACSQAELLCSPTELPVINQVSTPIISNINDERVYPIEIKLDHKEKEDRKKAVKKREKTRKKEEKLQKKQRKKEKEWLKKSNKIEQKKMKKEKSRAA
ncbi:hypothetical protein N9R79_07010 [Vibrio sp.]|nr:hypothetical protein [Vibrio sp.]